MPGGEPDEGRAGEDEQVGLGAVDDPGAVDRDHRTDHREHLGEDRGHSRGPGAGGAADLGDQRLAQRGGHADEHRDQRDDQHHRDGGGDVLPVLRERLRKLVCDFPIDQNYFAWQAFARHYKQEGPRALPPYLDPAAFATVSRMATRVAALNRSMTDVLAARAAASLDAYVLLDAQDWMTDDQLGALWQEITRTARPGARVIFRTGGADDILPGRVAPALLGRWRYDAPASRAGFAADRSAIYGGFHLYRFEG